MTITEAELQSRLWEAANALRGPVDPADFKTYVFPVLFWKWISDTWEHEHAQAVAVYGDALDPELEADYHRFTVPHGCLWGDVVIRTETIGPRIATALGRLEQANPDALAGVFGDAAWGNRERLPESALVDLLDGFDGIRLDPDSVAHDALGHAYEYLLREFAEASGKKAGEFFTPPAIVHLLVGILDPQPGESVYDPACGSGGMLVETVNAVRAAGGDPREVRLLGQEVNLTTSAIARMNLSFHRAVQSEIRRGDTLRDPRFRERDGSPSRFDVVIANPPFSLSGWGADTWTTDARAAYGIPPAKNGDYAWVQHMVASMAADTGRVGVVMPHGVLFRGGVEAAIRQRLVEDDRLEAVVGLPSNLFYSTSIPACLLVFKAAKDEDRRQHVLFVDGSARFQKQRNRNTMSEHDTAAILTAYRTGRQDEETRGVHARLVPLDEIKTSGFDLNIGRYVRQEAAEAVTLEVALADYAQARAARIDAERTMVERLAAAGIEVPGA